MKLFLDKRPFKWEDSYSIYYEDGSVAYKVVNQPVAKKHKLQIKKKWEIVLYNPRDMEIGKIVRTQGPLGGNKFEAFWSACVPQILPVYLSHCLYCFEMNIRASAILGYVGAGGLGITINERIGWRDYESLGTVLLTLFVVVTAIEFFSAYLRKKLS